MEKRNLKNVLIKAEEKTKRNQEIDNLLKKRDDLDAEIEKIRVQNELEDVTANVEEAESFIAPFLKSGIALSSESELTFILSEEDKETIYEKIFEFYGTEIPLDSSIKTFGDLVYIMGKLKNG